MPKILALETTEKWGSVALSDGDHLIAEISLPRDRRSAQTLARSMDALLREARCEPKEIGVVGVVVGPGSFTGLRVGVATAKMFAYAVGAQTVALNTFETIADDYARSPDPARTLLVGVDAQRGDVVVQCFQITGADWREMEPSRLIPIDQCWEIAQNMTDVCLAGPFLERWESKIPKNLWIGEERFRYPRASAACRLTAKRLAEGKTIELGRLLPVYSRLSAAEERILHHPASGKSDH